MDEGPRLMPRPFFVFAYRRVPESERACLGGPAFFSYNLELHFTQPRGASHERDRSAVRPEDTRQNCGKGPAAHAIRDGQAAFWIVEAWHSRQTEEAACPGKMVRG